MSLALRIGLLLDDSLDRPDGVQQYVLTLGNWLTQQGHTVHYLVGESKRQDIVNIHSLSRNIAIQFNKNRLSIPLSARPAVIQELLSKLKLDVLHVQLPCSPLMGSRVIACASNHTAVIGTFHIMPAGLLSKAGTRLLGGVQQKTLRRLDDAFAVSPPAQKFAERHYHAAVNHVIPNMIDTRSFKVRTERPTSTKQIIFLGRLVERKGCQYLLQSINQLKNIEGLPAYSVRIGGSGSQEPALKNYVLRHGLQDVVHFDGFIEPQAKAGFLAQADIAVFPATGGESFGIVLLEAMAARAGVVIGGNNPGYSSVLGAASGALFNPKDTEAFSTLLSELLANTNRFSELHNAQQALVKEFDVKLVGARILNRYQQAIAKRAI